MVISIKSILSILRVLVNVGLFRIFSINNLIFKSKFTIRKLPINMSCIHGSLSSVI